MLIPFTFSRKTWRIPFCFLFYRLMSLIRLDWIWTGFFSSLLGFTGFYWVFYGFSMGFPLLNRRLRLDSWALTSSWSVFDSVMLQRVFLFLHRDGFDFNGIGSYGDCLKRYLVLWNFVRFQTGFSCAGIGVNVFKSRQYANWPLWCKFSIKNPISMFPLKFPALKPFFFSLHPKRNLTVNVLCKSFINIESFDVDMEIQHQ